MVSECGAAGTVVGGSASGAGNIISGNAGAGVRVGDAATAGTVILGNLIVQLFLDFRNIPLGAAVSVVLLALSSIIIVFYMRVLRSVEEARI